jgi:hypothetical protein
MMTLLSRDENAILELDLKLNALAMWAPKKGL